VFGTPDEKLALVFDLLHQNRCQFRTPNSPLLEGK